MSADNLPTIEYLKQCFRYEDGKLFWLVRPLSHFKNAHGCNIRNAQLGGTEAGYLHQRKRGDHRWMVSVFGKMMYRSRIVWAMHNENWPSGLIDHKNRITHDDRIENLRDSTDSQNQGNRKVSRNCTSGLKGVYWRKDIGKWQTAIGINGKPKYLGYYDTREEAHAVYRNAAADHFGEFAYNGDPTDQIESPPCP